MAAAMTSLAIASAAAASSMPSAILPSSLPVGSAAAATSLNATNPDRVLRTDVVAGTAVAADALASATRLPVPLQFGPSNVTINSGLKKDNYGVLRAYPQPFYRGIHQMGQIAGAVTGEGPDVPPHFFQIPIDEPTCFLTPSGQRPSVDPFTNPAPTNCTHACMDPRLLFEPTTFATCIQLATAAVFVDAGQARVDVENDYTRSTSQDLAFSTSLRGFNGTKVLRSTISCAVAACRIKGNGACSDDIMNLENLAVDSRSINKLHDALAQYCDRAESVVNQDVAGPGVLMSYIFQTGIALLFFALVKLLNSVMRPLIWAYLKMRSASRTDAWKLSGQKQRRLALTRGNAAVISSMVEFQEVQGYFVAAIQVATLVTFRSDQGPNLNSVTSLGAILFNSSLVQMLAVSGVLPVLLVQCCLQRAGMRWWYMLLISSIVFILGMTVDVRGGYMLPPLQTVFDFFRDTAAVSQCGGNPNPLVYCTGDLDLVVSDDLGQNVSYYVYPSLVIEQASWWLWRRYAMERKARRWERSRPWARVFRRKIWPLVWYLYWLCLQVVLAVFTGMYFYNIFLLVFDSMQANDQTWTYGQLVAVMLWAPILGKYLYFNIFGIEEGIGRRLAKHYKIVYQERDDSEEEDDDTDSLDGHEDMEQGVELKVTPVQSTTTLPVLPSPSENGEPPRNSPNPSTALMAESPSAPSGPAPPPAATAPRSGPGHYTHPHQEPDFGSSEGVISVGGVVIAVENHDPVDRRGDV